MRTVDEKRDELLIPFHFPLVIVITSLFSSTVLITLLPLSSFPFHYPHSPALPLPYTHDEYMGREEGLQLRGEKRNEDQGSGNKRQGVI